MEGILQTFVFNNLLKLHSHLWYMYYYYIHFAYKEMWAERGWITCWWWPQCRKARIFTRMLFRSLGFALNTLLHKNIMTVMDGSKIWKKVWSKSFFEKVFVPMRRRKWKLVKIREVIPGRLPFLWKSSGCRFFSYLDTQKIQDFLNFWLELKRFSLLKLS